MRDSALLIPDLRSGGRALVGQVQSFKGRNDVLILGVVRAGVPVAVEIAKSLALPLDVVCLRRLVVDPTTSVPLCAVNVAGELVVDDRLETHEARKQPGFDYFLADALQQLSARVRLCRGSRSVRAVVGQTILLVDNGISTGQTILSVVRAVRALGPSAIIVVIPVAATELRPALESAVDQVICNGWHSPFGHVGMWYQKLDICPVEEIAKLLGETDTNR